MKTKRFIGLCLSLLFLSLVSCSSGLSVPETLGTQEQGVEKETAATEDVLTGEIAYPEGFSVGYNRQSIAPTVFPIPTYTASGYVGISNHDPVQLTCTALCDGQTVFLLISFDMRRASEELIEPSMDLIEKNFGIPKERVFINATHTHSSPDNSCLGEGNMIPWQKLYYEKVVEVVGRSLRDLSPAEAYAGTAHTDGVTFVRRYLMEDGTYKTNPKDGNVVAHETEADTELRTIRFDRGEAKDVLLVNYQTHYHGTFKNAVSAAFVHPLREKVEKDLDVHFSYHNGASGNLNFNSAISGERKYSGIEKASSAIADAVTEAVENEEKISVGTIRYEYNDYQGTNKNGKAKTVPLSAMTAGDLGFVAAPYEMFDTNGQEIRAASPCKMTFVCAYTNGHQGYIPSALAFSHGAYEVNISKFAPGSGEEFAQELVRLLKLCKEKA